MADDNENQAGPYDGWGNLEQACLLLKCHRHLPQLLLCAVVIGACALVVIAPITQRLHVHYVVRPAPRERVNVIHRESPWRTGRATSKTLSPKEADERDPFLIGEATAIPVEALTSRVMSAATFNENLFRISRFPLFPVFVKRSRILGVLSSSNSIEPDYITAIPLGLVLLVSGIPALIAAETSRASALRRYGPPAGLACFLGPLLGLIGMSLPPKRRLLSGRFPVSLNLACAAAEFCMRGSGFHGSATKGARAIRMDLHGCSPLTGMSFARCVSEQTAATMQKFYQPSSQNSIKTTLLVGAN